MTDTQAIWQTFRRLPRAAQWAVGGAAVVVVALIWQDYVLKFTDDLNQEADRLLAQVSEVAASGQRLKNLQAVKDVARGLGEVEKPGRERDAEAALNDAVNQVLKRHTVSRDSYNYRGPSQLRRGTLARIIPPGQQVERITGDLRFDATPHAAVAIIAQLEKSPRIEAVSNVRLTKESGQKVSVDLTIEAWVVSPKRRTTRARGG